MICAKPDCAQFIAKKLWRFFVQDQPPQPVIDALADAIPQERHGPPAPDAA